MLIEANGITIHAEDSGSGDFALVFLHYWGGTSRSWKLVTDTLPTGMRAIALDARGWGSSQQTAGGYDITTMADDVEAAIAALDLKRYVLVGHSMGGKVAQLLASRQPAGLAGLILLAPSPAQGKVLADAERSAMAGAYMEKPSIAWTIDNILTERALPASLRNDVIDGSLAGAAAAKQAWPLTAISEDVSANLGRVGVPVLIIGGEKDKVDGIEMLEAVVLPSLPGAKMSSIAGAGHLLPLEAPEEVTSLIRAFAETLNV